MTNVVHAVHLHQCIQMLEGTKSRIYRNGDRNVYPRLAKCSTVFKVVWSWGWSCCKRKVVLFSGLALEVCTFNLVLQCSSQSVADLDCRTFVRIFLFLAQKTVHITLLTEFCVLNFPFDGEFTCHHSKDCCFDSDLQWWHHLFSPVMMRSRKLSPSGLYLFSMSWQTCTLCSFCSCLSNWWDNLAQTCNIAVLPPLFLICWSLHSAPYKVP